MEIARIQRIEIVCLFVVSIVIYHYLNISKKIKSKYKALIYILLFENDL